MRNYSPIDHLLSNVDRGLRTMFVKPNLKSYPSPADKIKTNAALNKSEQQLSARLMRVNHAGEIAAQGLYHGQALTARQENIKQQMQQCAEEEQAHLAWCEKRLTELDDHPSVLSPVWYLGSYALGAATGLLGDKWSLGFISETEKQVVQHLNEHLSRLPEQDHKSREVLLKMREEEVLHDKTAQAAGAYALPKPVKLVMRAVSKLMTRTAYWV
jgi:ubiquinone biosynthesis monooxygenase Coq7